MKWSRDQRGWLEKLARENELKKVAAKVSCDGEIQEIGRRMSAISGPAVLFENIEGHENTWCSKLFIGSLNSLSKIALTFGIPGSSPKTEIIEAIRKTLRNPVKSQIVDTGPVKENIIEAKDVDINKIPVPQWHPQDQGRYINLWAGIVTRDPETGDYNVGAYRGVIHDKNHIGVLLFRTQGWGMHYSKYIKMGKPMPVACVYGWDPSLMFTAGSPVTTIDEYEWMGAIRGEPVPLVKCETCDLEVPASAEIVIEGHVPIDESTYRQEGPLKEVSGRYCEPSLMPVIEVDCITYRNDPVMTGSAIGLAPVKEEQVLLMDAGVTAVLRNTLEDQGLPGILDLTLAPFFAVKIDKTYQGQAFQVAASLFGHKALNMRFKMLVIVEDGVDLNEPRSVINAINANVDPARDIFIFPTQRTIVDTAMQTVNSKVNEFCGTLGNKMLIDATVNWDAHPRQDKFGGQRLAPPEPVPADDVEKVAKRWKEYGFEDLL